MAGTTATFVFYNPYCNKIIELPTLHLNRKTHTCVYAFTTSPRSSLCSSTAPESINQQLLLTVISFSCLFKKCYSTVLTTQSPSILLLTMNSRGKTIQNFFNGDFDDDDLHQQRVAMAVRHHTFLLQQYAQQSKHDGFVAGHEYKNRKREKHHKSLMEDYFCKRPLYPQWTFAGAVYGQWYIRSPNSADLYRLLHKASRRGFPGMLGSLDYMHWEWKNCPTAWAGQFTSYKHKPTVILKEVALYDTSMWHAFFGVAESNNDINVQTRSPLFNDVVNENEYNLGCYLVDGIYPRWATLVKTISQPSTLIKRLFAQKQEAYRKDVERAFGILQAQWAIVRGLTRMWRKEQLHSIMMTCIILHNMIVEDEYEDLDAESDDEENCPRTSRRARARLAYELEPTITYDINRDRQTISDYMAVIIDFVLRKCITIYEMI
ncbi:hypothetical protein Prudu_012596 [Prunus dulcis]|uniref:Uncharacterized protein n=1 Tax=Prunus dulcis TaxID=3755 RepID=A0A4Y1RDP2_PRUDU|nr:hypothetical protein Prudu_012596 [Prunus dulcis]